MITGIFTRLSDGSRAGTIHCRKKGYRVITIDHKRYQEHKLVRFYLFNDYHCEVDHKNGIRDDNRFKNLRKASSTINNRNRAKHRNNKSGITGVCWIKRCKSWQVTIISKRVGFSKDFFEACCMRKSAELVIGGFTSRHGI